MAQGPKKFQKLLWVHRQIKPTIDFPEMLYPMGGSLCPLVRQLVKTDFFFYHTDSLLHLEIVLSEMAVL